VSRAHVWQRLGIDNRSAHQSLQPRTTNQRDG